MTTVSDLGTSPGGTAAQARLLEASDGNDHAPRSWAALMTRERASAFHLQVWVTSLASFDGINGACHRRADRGPRWRPLPSDSPANPVALTVAYKYYKAGAITKLRRFRTGSTNPPEAGWCGVQDGSFYES
ncbi:MAG: hypothetical protein QM755_19390 [Luteolibacter sp.]